MARYVVMVEGTVIDGLKYPKGTVVNIPSANADIKALGAFVDGSTGAAATTTPLHMVPRLRNTATIGAGFTNLGSLPPYLLPDAVPTSGGSTVFVQSNLLGNQASTDTLPPGSTGPNTADVIKEPVLPVANSQYD